jgi:hypothetical protein
MEPAFLYDLNIYSHKPERFFLNSKTCEKSNKNLPINSKTKLPLDQAIHPNIYIYNIILEWYFLENAKTLSFFSLQRRGFLNQF